jgi:hypothetical protein
MRQFVLLFVAALLTSTCFALQKPSSSTHTKEFIPHDRNDITMGYGGADVSQKLSGADAVTMFA